MSDSLLLLWRVDHGDGSVCTREARFGFHNSGYGEDLRGRGIHTQKYPLCVWRRDWMLPTKYAWDGLEFL